MLKNFYKKESHQFLEILEKFDKNTSEIFFKTYSFEIINTRINNNEEFINKWYKFIKNEFEEDDFFELQLLHKKWIKMLEIATYFKADPIKKAFLNAKFINLEISNLEKKSNNIFWDKFFLIFYINLKLVKIKSTEMSLNYFDRDVDFDFSDKAFEHGIDFSYSRSTLSSLILKDLYSWLFIIGNTYKLELNCYNFDRLIAHFILYCEEENALRIKQTKKKLIKKSIISLVEYDTKIKNLKTLDFPMFYLKIAKEEPILFENKYFENENFAKASIFQISDYLFNIENLIKKNKTYGWLEEKKKNSVGGINIIKETEAPKIKLEKKQINMNVNNPRSKIFFHNLKKENKTRLQIDIKKFLECVNLYKKENLYDSFFLSLDTPDKELLDLLNLQTNIESNASKKFFSDLLTFFYLKIFYREILSRQSYFYYCFEYDFRGRKYFSSLISVTNFKLSRFFIFYGYYTSLELEKIVDLSLASNAVRVLAPILEGELFKNVLENIFINETYKNDKNTKFLKYKQFLAIHFFISIGIVKKTQILKDPIRCKDGYTLSTEDFFSFGLEEFNTFCNKKDDYFFNLDTEDALKLKFLFDKLIKTPNFFKKEMIGLDFSCSGHQLRYLYGGFQKIKNYDYINISGWDKSVDMYSFIFKGYSALLVKLWNFWKEKTPANPEYENFIKELEAFVKELKINFNSLEEIQELMSFIERKIVKNPIMISEYNATFPTFIKNFEKNFKKIKGEEIYEKIFLLNKKKFTLLLTGLFRYSKNLNTYVIDFKSEKNIDLLFNEIKSVGYRLIMWDGFEVNYAVFEKNKADVRVSLNPYLNSNFQKVTPSRRSQKLNLYSDIVSTEDTKRSLIPNFVHSLDGIAIRARSYYNPKNYVNLTVHDEFWIEFQEVFIFKDEINLILKLDFFVNLSESDDKSFNILQPDITLHPLSYDKLKSLYCYNIIF